MLGLHESSPEIFSLALVSGGVRWITQTSLRTQLLNQATSEVTVIESNYNIKVNQMGLGFRGQADKTAKAATSVSVSFRYLLSVSQELQASVSQFKLSKWEDKI